MKLSDKDIRAVVTGIFALAGVVLIAYRFLVER